MQNRPRSIASIVPLQDEYRRMKRILLSLVPCTYLMPMLAAGGSKIKRERLLDSLQWSTIRYMWDAAEENSGMALERIHLDGARTQKQRFQRQKVVNIWFL